MKIVDDVKKKILPSKDYLFKTIRVDGKKIEIIFNEVLTDGRGINEYILEELVNLNKKELLNLENKLTTCNCKIIKKDEILDSLNNGFVVIIYKKIYACEIRANLDRGVNTIESELSISGPKDSFSETYNTNLGLIRRRIKSCDLKVIDFTIGKISKTKVGLLYVDGICNKKLVKKIEKSLRMIDIDGIIDSSYLKNSLENKKKLFPTIMMSERPDKSSMALLEGKVVIIVDTSPYALILPSFFFDFFHTTDDYFQKNVNTTFIRIIRVFAFFIAIFTPAVYIAVTTRNYDLVPLPLLLMLKAGRTFVPFPAYIEALFMIVCFEILKESDLRMSTTSGSAISILGGLILGDAAVSAGIVSPIMIIVIAISSIAGLIFSSLELVNALRMYKIILLLLGTILGIYGVVIGAVIMFYNICTAKIYDYKYLNLDKNEIKDSLVKIDSDILKRNSKLTNNVIRGRYK
ncbi:MAG: spore germination protein [Bacilli bacterium]|nr:spore germination protein [Bacilli bacterium]